MARRLRFSKPKPVEPPLLISTFEERRSMIRFLLAENIKPCEIYRRMQSQYGSSCMNSSSFYSWVEKFKNGRTSIETEQRSGRPIEISTSEVMKNIERLILEDRRISVEEISTKLRVSFGTVHKIIHETLNFRKTSARCVPKVLSPIHKKKLA